ncbi:MAG: tyrosine-type recombinase/integrase [Cytophagales bacterium]
MTDSFFNHLEFEKRYSPHTIVSYRIDLEQFASFCKLDYHIDDIVQADYNIIRAWIVSLINGKLETKSVNRKLATLKSFYKFLLTQGILVSNPAQRVKTPKLKKRLPIFVEESQMQLLLNEIEFDDTFEGVRDHLVIELLYGTGIRLAELINLKDNDVNFYDKSLKVTGKGNKQRIIPLHENLLHALLSYNKLKPITFLNSLDFPHLICSNKGEKAYPVLIQRIVKKYLSLASNVEKKSPHVLRHSFATHMLNNGADLNAIKDLLGHSSLAATQVYTHNSLEKLKSVFKQAHPKA